MDEYEYWNVSWPVAQTDERGLTSYLYWEYSAQNEQDARLHAASQSRQHGHATVTNRTGLVATYVGGTEWHAPAGGLS